jgi:hypothetical protein
MKCQLIAENVPGAERYYLVISMTGQKIVTAVQNVAKLLKTSTHG